VRVLAVLAAAVRVLAVLAAAVRVLAVLAAAVRVLAVLAVRDCADRKALPALQAHRASAALVRDRRSIAYAQPRAARMETAKISRSPPATSTR
jgi:hypothetical protein